MVLLVFLAIVWAAAGIYWLRTRAPQANLSLGGGVRRLGALDVISTRRSSAPVVALRGPMGAHSPTSNPAQPGVTHLRPQSSPTRPGHSLTDPARQAAPGSVPQRTGVTSEQARHRRRNVLLGLAAAAALSLVGVFTIGGVGMILLHLFLDAALLGFVMLLVQYQRAIELDRTQNLPVYAAPRDPLASTGTDGRY